VRFLIPLIFLWGAAASAIGQTVGWRGDGTGQFIDAKSPPTWDALTGVNIRWSTHVGKSPNGSPIALAGKVLTTVAPATLVCLDARTGKLLWEATNTFADLTPPMPDRPPKGNAGNTVPTPVSDGHFVWVSFGNGIVACHDLNGQRQWIRWLDLTPAPEYGHSASPILVAGKLVLSQKHLLALDAKTGKTVWEAHKVVELHGSPIATRIGQTDVIITPDGQIVSAADGAVLARDVAELKYATPLVSGSTFYFIDQAALAVQLPERFEQPLAPRRLWDQDLEGEFFASPLCHDGLIYTVSNAGVYYVLDATTGKVVLERELDIPSASGKPGAPEAHLYPSPCLIGGQILVSNDIGDTLVLAPGNVYKELAHNRLKHGSGGNIAVLNDRLYVRDGENIVCIGK
jgi:outer membrane protein assembly factor BamB